MSEKEEKKVAVAEEEVKMEVAAPVVEEDPIDKVCSALWKLYDKKALIEAIKRGYVGVEYFKRLIARGADWKIALMQSSYSPILLELFRMAGVNLRSRNDALLADIVKKKFWPSLEYLVNFAGVPVDLNGGQLFIQAFEARDQEFLNVLLGASASIAPTLWAGPVGENVARSGWWEGIHTISLSPHFPHFVRDTPIFKEACLASAKHLVFTILMSHVFAEPPQFTEEEAGKLEPLIGFTIKEFLRVTPVETVPPAPVEDPLPPPPLQPQLFTE